jgi:hypothetical protein
MWKIRRPTRSKSCKVLFIFNGVLFTLLGCVYYFIYGNIGIVIIVFALITLLFSLFCKTSKSVNHQPEKMTKLQNQQDTDSDKRAK